jgi:hypothetical protein
LHYFINGIALFLVVDYIERRLLVFRRRHAGPFLERADKMAEMAEADLEANLRHRMDADPD